jgi:hypothetical protein
MILTSALHAQTTALPLGIFGGVSFNQLGSPREAGELGAYWNTSVQTNIGMTNSTTLDVVPVKVTDKATGIKYWSIEASARQGVQEKLLATGKWLFLAGGDVGAGAVGVAGAGVSFSINGSFDVIAIYRWKPAVSFSVPVRMLYINGGFNPVAQFNVIVHPGKLPPPAVAASWIKRRI